jgi:hypothetical protein
MEIDTSEIYRSGIIYEWEEIFETFKAKLLKVGKGFLIITNERLLFVIKPGFFSKGYRITFQCSLINISSVSILKPFISWVEIVVSGQNTSFFRCNNNKLLREKIVANKNRLFENLNTSGKKDNPQDILRKRLARGEITIEEFHRLVQRT